MCHRPLTRVAEILSHNAGGGRSPTPPPPPPASRAVRGAFPALRVASPQPAPHQAPPWGCAAERLLQGFPPTPAASLRRTGMAASFPEPLFLPPVPWWLKSLVLGWKSLWCVAGACPVRHTPCLCSAGETGRTRCSDGGKSHRGRETTILGRSWRMNLSVRCLLGFLWLPSHLRVNERQPVASGRHSRRR